MYVCMYCTHFKLFNWKYISWTDTPESCQVCMCVGSHHNALHKILLLPRYNLTNN